MRFVIPSMPILFLLALSACGIKAAPLPPIPASAQESDRIGRQRPSPTPSPTIPSSDKR